MIDVRARNNSSARNGLRFLLRGVSGVLTLLFITSCGNDIFLVGTPVITLTAQRGNFTSYMVTIDEIEMTRKDGTIIELPTVSEQVDLANLGGNFVQLLEAPPVGIGTYLSVTFFLDYGTSYVTIDSGGQAGPTTLIDASTGTTPTVDTITVNFDPDNPLVITNQNASLVNFNIDLEASNTIDYGAGVLPATVTVHPMFTVTAVPVYQKPVFTRGLFVVADTKSGTFVMNSRPLHDVLNNPFGAINVIPNDQTYYNIYGVTYVGAAGFAVLAAMQSQTYSLQIGAVGSGPGYGSSLPFSQLTGLNPEIPAFTAQQIYAGSSLESTIQDHITGIVAGRSGECSASSNCTLTVLGAALVDRLGEYGFTNTIPVTIGPNTIVSVDGVANPSPAPTVNTLSIGQYIDISGQVNPNDPGFVNPDGTLNPDGLDATAGQIRMQPTKVWGVLNSGTATSATVSLAPVGWIQNYEPLLINFAGTGTSSATDAVSTSYNIATPSDQSATAPGTLLQFVGVTTPYGSGPPYFTANTVSPATSVPQELVIEWSGGGSPNPFTSVGSGGFFVNLDDAALAGTQAAGYVPLGGEGGQAYVRSGPQLVAVTKQANPHVLAIMPAPEGSPNANLFSIGNTPNGIFVYSNAAEFATRILYNIGSIGPMQKLTAFGQYDPNAGTFVATDIKIAAE
jgi:hypothetical protein